MATNITTIMRASNANAVDDISRLLTKIGATGSPSAIFTVTVPTTDDDRRDTVLNHLIADPNILNAAYA